MNKFHVIVHPSDMAQSDWVRLILPMMEFMRANVEQVKHLKNIINCSHKLALR